MDYQSGIINCACGDVTLDGSTKQILCKNKKSYSEVDDEGNDISLKEEKLTKEVRLDMLKEMINSYENLPQNAMMAHITHYDFISALLLLESILRED